jgi:alkylation response protein AidB-like acyl-CoA dehydrogenase
MPIDYRAPLDDMQFILHQLIPMSVIANLPGYEDISEDLVNSILDEADKIASQVLSPLNWSGDQAGCVYQDGAVQTPEGFKQAYQQYSEAGWISLAANTDFGGQGLPLSLATPVNEMWHSANMAFMLCPMLTAGAIEAIEHHATPEQQAIYLPPLISGQWAGTMNLTEPSAGSDLSAVSTKAVPEGDHFRIIGTKIYITYGEHDFTENIIHLVLARLPDAPAGVKGISLFIVPKWLINQDGSLGARNDIRCLSIEHKLGIHASPTAVMAFGEKTGAIGYLVGEANRGLEYMFTMMNNARLAVGLEGVAIAERAYQHAAHYAKERVQGRIAGRSEKLPIVHHADVQRMLMRMKTQTEAMRALAYLAAAQSDFAQKHPDKAIREASQLRVDLLTPIVKAWCTEQAIEITSLGIQVHGGMGYIEETGAAQYLRDARITSIYEGTTGIQAIDLLGRKIIRDEGAEARHLLTEIQACATDLSSSSSIQLQQIATNLQKAVLSLSKALDWVLHEHATNPQATFTGAYPLLQCFGFVCGGWLMAKAAFVSEGILQIDASNVFALQKIASATFYSQAILPQVHGLADTVFAGASLAQAMRDSLTDLLR